MKPNFPTLGASFLAVLTVFMLHAPLPTYAQIQLEGRVLDAETNLPLAGANVGIANTTRGTSTDNNGNFRLRVDGFPVTLAVSFVGYEAQEVTVSTNRFTEIALAPGGIALEDMVVVGSRFAPRTVTTSPIPVDNIKAAEMIATGQPTFDRMLTYTVPAFNSSQQTISDATAHFDPADLRGLGPSRTLVLVNGKRKSQSALVYINDTPGKGEVGVDMKSIPTAAISRIEVLRDGASAQYGSDAIAGVINIILKEEVGVTDVDVFGGVTSEGDGRLLGYSVNTGFRLGEKGFLNLTHSLSDQEETNRSGEPCAGTADPATCDGLFGGLFGLVNTPESQAWVQANPGLGMRVGRPNMFTVDGFFNAELPLDMGATVYAFGGMTYRDGKSYALYRAPYWIPDTHNLLHDAGTTYQGFQPTFETAVYDQSLAAGVRGQYGAWSFDLSNSFGRNQVDYTVGNSLNLDLGAQSPTSFDAGGYRFFSNVSNLDVSRRFNNVTFTAGTEFRIENFEGVAGDPSSYAGAGAQSFPGLQPQNAVDESRSNIGVYGDLGVDLTPDFFLGGAARFESYSDFGENFTWKVNGRYKLMEDRVSVRAAASTGFRAPSLHQIYLSIIQTLVSGGTVSNQGTFNNESEVLERLDVPQLTDENALNLTAGVAINPVPGLTASLDVYQVEVDDRIVYSSSIASSQGVVGQVLNDFNITSLKFFINAVDTRTRGLDFVLSYNQLVGPGRANVSFAVNVNDTEIQGQISTPAPIAAANVDIFDRKEQSRILSARPSDKEILTLGYEWNALRVVLNNTRFGTVTWQHATDPANDQEFAAKILTDLYVHYQFTQMLGLGVAVNNVFDVYPEEIDEKSDPLTTLGGRFRYPWEVNQFGFAGTTFSANLTVQF